MLFDKITIYEGKRVIFSDESKTAHVTTNYGFIYKSTNWLSIRGVEHTFLIEICSVSIGDGLFFTGYLQQVSGNSTRIKRVTVNLHSKTCSPHQVP